MTKFAAVVLAASVAFAAPAFAQDNGSVTLKVDSGSVMTSNGGDYATAASGQSLASGDKVMVNENSSATLTYGNGCKMQLTQPGVYTVPAQCNAVAGNTSGGSSGANAGIIAGTAAVIGAVINNEDNTPNGPLSTGIRHF